MKKILLFILLTILCISIFTYLQTTKRIPSLTIAFLDIGQGDAALITFPDKQQMLVDCAQDARVLEALGRVMPFYDRSIDYLVISHPHLDHFGGCEDVLKRFTVDHIVIGGFHTTNASWKSFIESVKKEQADVIIPISVSSTNIGGVDIDWLYPDHNLTENPHVPGVTGEVDPNNTSIVFRLTYGKTSALFTGDAEKEEEEYLLEKYPELLDADILKAGHHGSNTSSLDPFLEVVTPLHTVFSAGMGNQFGHPSERTMRRVERHESRVWRTDTQGDILLHIEEDAYWINGQIFYVD